MSYLAAAYGIVALTVAGYALYLVRERRELARTLRGGEAGPPDRASRLDGTGASEI